MLKECHCASVVSGWIIVGFKYVAGCLVRLRSGYISSSIVSGWLFLGFYRCRLCLVNQKWLGFLLIAYCSPASLSFALPPKPQEVRLSYCIYCVFLGVNGAVDAFTLRNEAFIFVKPFSGYSSNRTRGD